VTGSGLAKRVCGSVDVAGRVLREVASVLERLPVADEPVGVFAARVCANAHALDEDRPTAVLVFGAIVASTNAPVGAGASWRRDVWAGVGLLRDELSSTVLTLGLPGDTASATGRALAILGEAGQPVVLTLRQVVREPPKALPAGACVYVCENPVVVAAAAEGVGAHCPPLVCVQGQSGAGALSLLAALTAEGASLRVHGDFDWGGLRIVSGLAARFPWQPWRYRVDDYRAAVAARPGVALTGTPSVAAWDVELAPEMAAFGVRVEEESVVDDLVADLLRAAPRGRGQGRG